MAGLAVWTTAVWIVRSLTILAGDRATGFKVVHGVLAVVSIALAVWAVRAVRRADDVTDVEADRVLSRFGAPDGA